MAAISGIVALPAQATATDAANRMDVLAGINTRRSVRAYTDEPVSQKDVDVILSAAMMAPSAMNEQPWEFVVVRDRAILNQIAQNCQNASMAQRAPLAILLCLDQAREKANGMAIIDLGMCAQNLLLAAHAIGLGAVFTGIYPDKKRMRYFHDLFTLPDSVLPIGLIVLGHPKLPGGHEIPERFNKNVIHNDKW